MEAAARPAQPDDVLELVRLYRLLETEMTALKPVWRFAEGLPEPVGGAFGDAFAEPSTTVYLGTYGDVAAGFLLGRSEPLLPQAGAERMASIRLLFTEEGFREMGIAEALVRRFMADHSGHRYFDAHVSPGHRVAKNFFEANGFAARHIVMHHDGKA